MADKDKKKKRYNLSNIEIDTVGLVTRGAVDPFGDGQNFFLFKSYNTQEAPMPDEDVTIEEVADNTPEEVSLFAKLEKWWTEKTAQPEAGETGETRQEEPTDATAHMAALVATQKAQNEALIAQFRAETHQVVAELNKAHEAKVEELTKAHADKVAGLEEQLKVFKSEAQEETKKRRQQEFLAKASELTALGVSTEELGDKLNKLYDGLDEEDAKWLENLLKANDNMLRASGVWTEIGTTETPLEKSVMAEAEEIAKAQNIPLAEAILQLDSSKQRMLLAESRKGKGA